MSEPRIDDKRIQGVREPNVSLKALVYHNYKDLIALVIIILCIIIFAVRDGSMTERLETVLTMMLSASTGFLFGKRVR